jgi:heat shock protein HtpX
MNAFATGLNRKESLVAFSSSLVENMSASQISAVAAHEIAHIANGDMVAMSIIQSSVMAFSIIIQIPLTIINYFFFSISREENFADIVITGLITLLQFITFKLTMFLGNLFALHYSRKREFLADSLSAKITSSESMRNALIALKDFTHPTLDKNEPELAMFKISTNEAIIKLLSSHPPISERIQRLQNANEIV